MTMNILESAASLSDHDLLAGLERLTGDERRTTVDLLAHLAVLDTRAILYAAEGYGTLFAYCSQALRLSEDAACSRIAVARACRRFPPILDLLASGAMTLTGVRMLAPHLTPENHAVVLERATGGTVRQIEELVADIAPRADVRSSVRKQPAIGATITPAPEPAPPPVTSGPSAPLPTSLFAPATARRPVIEVTAPARYRIQFTVGQETHDTLRRLQTLLRREIPNGDPGEIVGRALDLLLDKVERTKMAAAEAPRPRPQPGNSIRFKTDNDIRTPVLASRHIPRDVRRDVWRRDGGQCAFVASSGRRCSETTFLELHHVHAYAKGGPATFANIALRCRRHNQYEADLLFGRWSARARNDMNPSP
jgi:5-methylcytosine-specific restriction endonuclease McrA